MEKHFKASVIGWLILQTRVRYKQLKWIRVSAQSPGAQKLIPSRVLPKTLKSVTQGTQHQQAPATCWRHLQGVYLYIKLPQATETGDSLLLYGPHGWQPLPVSPLHLCLSFQSGKGMSCKVFPTLKKGFQSSQAPLSELNGSLNWRTEEQYNSSSSLDEEQQDNREEMIRQWCCWGWKVMGLQGGSSDGSQAHFKSTKKKCIGS